MRSDKENDKRPARMNAYLYNVKPKSLELVVDEMLYYGLGAEDIDDG